MNNILVSDEQKLFRKRKRKRIFRDNMALLLLAMPGIVFMLIFQYWPMLGTVIAFKNYVPRKGIWGSPWVGFDNFKFFFNSQDAFRTIRNTVLYESSFLVVDLIIGMLFALLLYHIRNTKALKAYHTVIMLPRYISIMIVSFIVYSILSPSYGVLNQVIMAFGGEKIQWYSKSEYWPIILTIVHIWQITGSGSLYYYSALSAIDETLFEAASIEGANVLQKCWHIAIPSMIPIATITTILGLGSIFSGEVGLFYNVPLNQGILYPATDTINTYTYRALLDGSLNKSSAVGFVQSITGLVLVVCVNAVVKKISPENSLF